MELLRDVHAKYIRGLDDNKDNFAYWATEQLRVSGAYWGLAAMELLGKLDTMDAERIVKFVLACQTESGGFAGNIGHDAHLLYTLSAVQILVMFRAIDRIDQDRVARYVASLQQADGSFVGDKWGEVDTRFVYCAANCLALLHRIDLMNKEAAVKFILACKNFDEAFGSVPGAESHAGQVFCCVGALAILGALDTIDHDKLGWWLAERQLPNGGLNGRPEKLEDVCYSWWVLSALAILRRLHWINRDALVGFILQCQDAENGGISDRPNDMADVYHTFFGIAGLSLLGYPDLAPVDPVYALSSECVARVAPSGLTYEAIVARGDASPAAQAHASAQ